MEGAAGEEEGAEAQTHDWSPSSIHRNPPYGRSGAVFSSAGAEPIRGHDGSLREAEVGEAELRGSTLDARGVRAVVRDVLVQEERDCAKYVEVLVLPYTLQHVSDLPCWALSVEREVQEASNAFPWEACCDQCRNVNIAHNPRSLELTVGAGAVLQVWMVSIFLAGAGEAVGRSMEALVLGAGEEAQAKAKAVLSKAVSAHSARKIYWRIRVPMVVYPCLA